MLFISIKKTWIDLLFYFLQKKFQSYMTFLLARPLKGVTDEKNKKTVFLIWFCYATFISEQNDTFRVFLR